MKFIVLTVSLISIAVMFCNCHRTQTVQNNNDPKNILSTIPPLDTLSVLRTLCLSKEDSLFIHSNKYSNPDTCLEEQIQRETISPNLPPIDVHSVIQIYSSDSESYLGSYVILIKHSSDSLPIQRLRQDSIQLDVDDPVMASPKCEIADFNFDGFNDIHISFSTNTWGGTTCNYFWRFDSSQMTFVKDQDLNKLFSDEALIFDPDKKEISTGGFSGAIGGGFEDYRWNGKTYEPYAQEESYGYLDNLISTRKELVDGQWKIVKVDTTPIVIKGAP